MYRRRYATNPDVKWQLLNIVLGSFLSAAFGVLLGQALREFNKKKKKKKR